jgi:hypothetical protein
MELICSVSLIAKTIGILEDEDDDEDDSSNSEFVLSRFEQCHSLDNSRLH